MRTLTRIVAVAVLCVIAPSVASAQRFAFERTIQTSGSTRLDVSTDRGTIEVVGGRPGRIVVEGAAAVRVGWNVPANAVALAKQVAAAPPIEHTNDTVRLRLPVDPTAQQAVIMSYRVEVPPGTEVRTRSDSGSTTLRSVDGAVDVRTQSSFIDVADISGAAQLVTGSGNVRAHGMSGAVSVTTQSSAITLSGLRSSLRIRTQSGAVNADLTGTGDVEVETGSSAINVNGAGGGLNVRTQSGRVTVQGAPTRGWKATTGSSEVHFDLARTAGFTLDAVSRSSTVDLTGADVTGTVSKHAIRGDVGGGGPTVMVRTDNGAIRIRR